MQLRKLSVVIVVLWLVLFLSLLFQGAVTKLKVVQKEARVVVSPDEMIIPLSLEN